MNDGERKTNDEIPNNTRTNDESKIKATKIDETTNDETLNNQRTTTTNGRTDERTNTATMNDGVRTANGERATN